jgi:predicted nuclease of predicted toxin-antitoxin system
MAIQYRFLFDECLCTALADLAHGLGYEATSIRNLNRLGDPDSAIAAFAAANDWIVVTNNRADYVRLYARIDLHPGLVVLMPSAPQATQLDLFAKLANMLIGLGDLTNKLIEIDRDGTITTTPWPPERRNDTI